VIIAGYGRFGQIAGRLLAGSGFSSTILEADVDQIELLRRFGRPVHYGDATRLDLLRAAGAERARMLIVAIDDAEKATELVETAHKAFPNLTILARAFDRRHAYDLLTSGAAAVERETFEGALAMGATALRRLGLRSRQAHRAAAAFRNHDRHMFETLAPKWGQEEAYLLASRDAARTMDQLLQADLASLRPDGQDAWNADGLEAQLREEARR
jgi:voltage-gated potassium channel Kch